MKVIELFAGIGSQTQALKNIGIEHEVIGIAEIDKYAVKSYEAIHGEVNNLGDICKIERLPECDLLTYSFPCQDLSVAGKGAGIKEGTRSGLLLEVERLLEVSDKPKYLLMENVKNLVGKKNKPDFDRWCEKLESMGYTNYWKVLNAKHYGIPQNRERVFMVSIFGEHEPYRFPEGFDNGMRLKDLLEHEVDEKFYLSDESFAKLMAHNKRHKEAGHGFQARIIDTKNTDTAICPTIYTVMHRGDSTYIGQDGTGVAVKQATKQGFAIAHEYDSINLEQPNSNTRRGRVGRQIANTLTCGCNQAVVEPNIQNYRIRKLTPLECWRLMGFKDEQFQKAVDAGVSNSQLYKQAGNSIVVDVLEHIFMNLFEGERNDNTEN